MCAFRCFLNGAAGKGPSGRRRAGVNRAALSDSLLYKPRVSPNNEGPFSTDAKLRTRVRSMVWAFSNPRFLEIA
jgi:hypothetical protein